MEVQILVGQTLFSINSEMNILWRPEERQFFYCGESYRKQIFVDILVVDELPDVMIQEMYYSDGLRIGTDPQGNEVRIYDASFLPQKPVYATSVLIGSKIKIFYLNDRRLLENPNIRLWNMLHMETVLLEADALVLHCSYLVINNQAILFSAPSGTGKTTQAKLWEKLYSAKIINGDKALIQKKNNIWYACGYPFHGSAAECDNADYPIHAIVIVRQNANDYIEELRPVMKLQAIYSETTVNVWNQGAVNKTLDLISDLIRNVKVVCQQCTMQDNACHTLHRYLKEK